MPNKDYPYEKVLVIWNPASTNAKKLKRRTSKLIKSLPNSPKVINIQTSSEGREANKKLLLKNKQMLGAKTLLCIAAGDGTVNLVIETLLTDPKLSNEMRKTIILPLWGGNANDLAHMLNGYYLVSKLKLILETANLVKVKPLVVKLTDKKVSQTRIAAAYVSFGATAFAAHKINQPIHRKSLLNRIKSFRLIAEAKTVFGAFIDVPTFKIDEYGVEKDIYEYAVVNGPRIAKMERLPIRLTDNGFYLAKIYQKHPIVIIYILRILRRRKFGRVTSNQCSFTIIKPTWMQLDGEVVQLKKGTKVQIELGNTPFYTLSRRLSPKV